MSSEAHEKGPVFTKAAQRVLAYAREMAASLRNNYVGPEHMLFGLLREQEGLAARVLAGQGFDESRVGALLQTRIGSSDDRGQPELLPRTRKLLDLAADEAKLRDVSVGTEHLLLGLIRERELDGASVIDMFVHLHVDPTTIRSATLEAIAGSR